MNNRGCRINVIFALGQSAANNIPLRDFKQLTAEATNELLPEPLHCFARVVERFTADDFTEFSEPFPGEALLVISEDLVTSEGSLRASQLAIDLANRASHSPGCLALVGLTSAPPSEVPAVPPLGLDYLVPTEGDLASHLAEAIRQVAPRIWLTLPTADVARKSSAPDTASDVIIDFARTEEEFQAILHLRFSIYSALGYLSPEVLAAKNRYDLDAFDPNAIHLVARDTASGEILGCARLIAPDSMLCNEQRRTLRYTTDVPSWCRRLADAEPTPAYRNILRRGTGGLSLPGASMNAYRSLRGADPSLRAENCCELSRLIVAPKARGHHLARRLTEVAVHIAAAWQNRAMMLVECREYHRSMYERLGFNLTADLEPETAGSLRTTAITLWRKLPGIADVPPHQPNAHVVVPTVPSGLSRADDMLGQARRTLPMEAWIWGKAADFADRSMSQSFELSLHNHGLICDTLRGLNDLLTQTGSRRFALCNKRGDSVEIIPSGATSLPVGSIVQAIEKLIL